MCRWRVCMLSLLLIISALPVSAWSCAVCWGGDEALSRGLNASVFFYDVDAIYSRWLDLEWVLYRPSTGSR